MVDVALALLVAAAAPAGFVVEAQTCPDAAEVERALAARVAVNPTRGPLVVVVTAEADGQRRLRLEDAQRALLLTRPLPADEDCAATAEAVALMVDRYLRALGWTAGTPPPTATAPDRDARGEGPDRPAGLALDAGLLWWTRVTGSFEAALGLRARIVGPFALTLATWLPPARRTEVFATGTTTLRAWPVVLGLRGERPLARVTLDGGVDALATFERGTLVGVGPPDARSRTVLALGLAVGARTAMGPRWRLAATAGIYRTWLGHSFVVGQTTVLDPPAWQGALSLAVSWIASQ